MQLSVLKHTTWQRSDGYSCQSIWKKELDWDICHKQTGVRDGIHDSLPKRQGSGETLIGEIQSVSSLHLAFKASNPSHSSAADDVGVWMPVTVIIFYNLNAPPKIVRRSDRLKQWGCQWWRLLLHKTLSVWPAPYCHSYDQMIQRNISNDILFVFLLIYLF